MVGRMSEIPAPLMDAIKSHTIPSRPAVLRRLALHRGDKGVAWRVEGRWWSLPPAAAASDESDEVELCRYTTPEGFAQRFESVVVLQDDAPATEVIWGAASDVLDAWRRGELLLDPAARHAFDADGIGGAEPAYGVRTIPLRTPTLPPATHTNLYFVGHGRDTVLVDPGSPYPEELDRAAAVYDRWVGRYGPAAAIFLTHHHGDHTGGADQLRQRIGLPIWAHEITAGLVPFDVDRQLADGEAIGEWTAVFTPGHAPGHLCLWNRRSRLVVAGDMVASIGTIVVEPSEGDMALYLDSLTRLKTLDPVGMYPAHGAFIDDPHGRLDGYRSHRLWREARILEALAAGPGPLSEITKRAYTDVASAILWLAERSTLAHLVKLQNEGRALQRDTIWRLGE